DDDAQDRRHPRERQRVAPVEVEVLLEDGDVVLQPEGPVEQGGAVERAVPDLQRRHDEPEEREQAPQEDDEEQRRLAPDLRGGARRDALVLARGAGPCRQVVDDRAHHSSSVPMTRSRPSSVTKIMPMPMMKTKVRVDSADPRPGSGVRTTYCCTRIDSDSVPKAPPVITCGRS